MKRIMGFWLAGLWIVAGGAWGQAEEPQAQGSILLDTGKIQPALFSTSPVRLPTAAGLLSFLPSEWVRIGFPAPGKCVVTTVYKDRWVLDADPQILRSLIVDDQLNEVWDSVREVKFLSTTAAAEPVAAPWSVELNDASLVHLIPDEGAVRVETSHGRIDIPFGMIQNLQMSAIEDGLLAMVEISPGGYGIQGVVSGSPLQGTDLGGRRIRLPWNSISRLARTDQQQAETPALWFDQVVSCRLNDGQEVQCRVPISILTVEGRGGTWSLPTTRILHMQKNPNGTFSIQTTVGEWLSGSVKPKSVPVVDLGDGTVLSFADCQAVKWPNTPVDMPENSLAWRLKTGDLLVGEWRSDSVAVQNTAGAYLRVRNSASMSDLPVQVNGNWPVSRFNVVHGADGALLKLSAAMVEAVRKGPVAQMPPAVLPNGPSAVWSDEILMPGGSFRLGRSRGDGPPDETPPVDLSLESFWCANTPVTVSQFGAFVEDTRYVTDAERMRLSPVWRSPGFSQRPDDPVVCVSWRDAVQYCNWRSAKAGLKPCYDIRRAGQEVVFDPRQNGYRLPLEAEWEFAARSGGLDLTYSWGEEDREGAVVGLANFRLSGTGLDPWPWTNPVKAFPPSKAGFHDMGGNVWQWCQDIYREDAYSGALRGEGMEGLINALPGRGERRVMRGGSYYNTLEYLRCAARGHGVESMNAPRVGFRVARNAEAGAR